ncbi:MAG: hypothetical protein ABJA66_21340 [Actinomycetota bacterium]
MQDAMTVPENSFFRIEENEVLFLTIGYTQIGQRTGWLDQAVIFCPFCGKKLQDREEIALNSQTTNPSDPIN